MKSAVISRSTARTDNQRQWYAFIEGEETGPVSFSELVAHARAGRLASSRSHVWREDDRRMRLATDVEELRPHVRAPLRSAS